MSSPRTEPLAEALRDTTNDTVDPKGLQELRRNWKWAAVCDFLWTFNTAMRLDLLNYYDLEKDIINGSTTTMATVIIKMLFSLTAIRGLGAETWQIYLRRHLAKRDEKNPLLGTDDDPREIKDLTIDQRLGLMHNLCEWQFQDPARLRQNMGHNDDNASWRTLPIGRDAKRNTYWQYGRDRLWVQRPTTKAPETPVQKGKKGGKAKATAKLKKEDPSRQTLKSQSGQAGRAARARARAMGTRLSSRLRRGEGDPEWQEPPEEWLQGDRKKPKEDRKGDESDRGSGSIFNADSDLTEISDNELVVPPDRKSARKVVTSDNEEDTPFGSGSLTEIDDEKEKEEAKDEEDETKEAPSEEREKTLDPKDPNFIELETICLTLDDWKKFAAKFEKSQHKDEKRLHKHIIKWIIPDLESRQEELDEIERKRQDDIRKREEAAAKAAAAILEKEDPKFKRQTRRAGRAGELGSDERALRRQKDLVELEERRRRGEADAKLDDNARTKRASARSARRSMIEERFDGEGSETFPEGDEVSAPVSDRGRDEDEYKDEDEIKRSNPASNGRTRRAAALAAEALTQPKAGRRRRRQDSDVEMDEDEPWFLNCQICHRTGWNENDGQKLLACSSCDIWQHVACHDLADRRDGRPKRDWKVDKFTCKSCLEKAANKRTRKRRKKDIIQTVEAERQDGANALGEQPAESGRIGPVPAPVSLPAPAPPMHLQSPPKQFFAPQQNGRPMLPQMHPYPQQPYEFAQLQIPIPPPSVPLGEAPQQMGYPPYPQTSFPNGHGIPMPHHFNIPPGPYPQQQHIGPHAPMMMPPQPNPNHVPMPPWNQQPGVVPNGVPMMNGMNVNRISSPVHRQQQYFMGNPGQ